MESTKQVRIIIIALLLIFGGGAAVLLIGSSLLTHPIRIMIALGILIAAAEIFARVVAYFMTKRSGFLFYPNDTSLKPPPAYSQAQTRRIKGDFEAAMELYTKIVSGHPQEIRAWIAMVEIALEDLNDAAMAKNILKRGLAALDAEGGKKVLQKSFDEKIELLPEKNVPE